MTSRHLRAGRVTDPTPSRRLCFVLLIMLSAGISQAQIQRTYTVKAGDTLYRIAVNHDMTVGQLQALNGIEGTKIRVGQMLRMTSWTGVDSLDAATTDTLTVAQPAEPIDRDSPIPLPPPPAKAPARGGPSVISAVTDSSGAILYGEYAAGEGESLYDLAFGLGIPLDTLLFLNPEHALVLADGGPIRVPGEFATVSYSIRPGDSLSRIASTHDISLKELKAANPGAGDVIQIGKTLRVPSAQRLTEVQLPPIVAEGPASVYPDRFVGRLMASGAEYDSSRFLLAHPTLPFGTIVLIENSENGRSTFAEVADRMPVSSNFVVEVSAAVAEALDLSDASIEIRIIQPGPKD